MPGADLDDRLGRLLRTVQDGVTAGDPAAVVRRGRRRRLARRTAGVGAVAVLLATVVVVAALLLERGPHPAATGPTAAGVPDGVVAWSDAAPAGTPLRWWSPSRAVSGPGAGRRTPAGRATSPRPAPGLTGWW
jgi:hypothetical protein